jgi:CRP/FNR family transcriptional regulator
MPIDDETLRRVQLFRRLKPEDRRRLASVSVLRRFRRGDSLFSEGDPSDAFFTVVEGRVKVFKTTADGKDLILELFGPGDPIGAVAVYEERPYPASARAIEDTVCILVPRQHLFRLLEQHPSLVRGLLLALTRRLVELTDRLAELTGGKMEPRFARLFLKLADDEGVPVGGEGPGVVRIPLALSRQELADLAGTTVETTIRIMSRWGKAGLVETVPDGFVLRERAALEAMARS